jgi:uncharacterized membrane protein YqiK
LRHDDVVVVVVAIARLVRFVSFVFFFFFVVVVVVARPHRVVVRGRRGDAAATPRGRARGDGARVPRSTARDLFEKARVRAQKFPM